ncbi:MAG TPA: hypothetical protein VE890_05760 [Thermoguttaceae bacterium]|nr:hypothetical protein [Thermoguttaceae bacterium]
MLGDRIEPWRVDLRFRVDRPTKVPITVPTVQGTDQRHTVGIAKLQRQIARPRGVGPSGK